MSGKPTHEEFSLIYAVGRVNQGIRREMNLRLAGLGLSAQEYTTLSVLRARPGLSNAQLARRSLVAPQSMIEILTKLERRGLVRRDVDPAHGRIRRAALTPAGRRLLDRADPAISAVQELVFAKLPAIQRTALKQGLMNAIEALSARES
jgi:DNA-binding MarR family transcriptional regulator